VLLIGLVPQLAAAGTAHSLTHRPVAHRPGTSRSLTAKSGPSRAGGARAKSAGKLAPAGTLTQVSFTQPLAGGKIEVESTPSAGTRVLLSLPALVHAPAQQASSGIVV